MTALKLMLAVVMVGVAVVHGAELGHYLTKRAVLLDENFVPIADAAGAVDNAPLLRQRRDSGYGPLEPHKGYKPYSPGKVGPVYTFVKTDYNGNFKWGVRHRAEGQLSKESLGAVGGLGVNDGEAFVYPILATPLLRTRRSPGGYGGPPIWVNTYAMTDYHGNFKWGVKHNVGHGGHH